MDDGRRSGAVAIVSAGDDAAAVAARVEQAFAQIAATRMQGLPFVNPALTVEAVGFRRWEGRWLGVLVTPWCMNLMLLPDEPCRWQHARYGDALAYALPAGVFEFISAREPLLGVDYQSCSLFSPMFEFGDQDGARATAQAALGALFDGATQAGREGPGAPMPAPAAEPQRPAGVSKRDFLRGRWNGDTGGDAGDGS